MDTENSLMVDRWNGDWGLDEKSKGVKKFKLVDTK